MIELEGRRIKRVGTRASLKVPPRAEVIDCGTLTVMPGMIDAHLHTMMFNCLTFHNYRVAQWEITPELQQMYGLFHAQLCFDMGFTTLRDLGLNSSGVCSPRSVRCARRDQRRHRRGTAHADRRIHHHHRLAPRPLQPRAMQRLGFRPRWPVGAAQTRAHQSPRRLRHRQDLRNGGRGHRQGGARHPQH